MEIVSVEVFANSTLCANCNESGNIKELSVSLEENRETEELENHQAYFEKIKVWEALQYMYDIPWKDISEKLKKTEKQGSEINNLGSELFDVILCEKCAPLLSKSYRFQTRFEKFCHPKSLLKIVKSLFKPETSISLQENFNFVNKDREKENGDVGNNVSPDQEREDCESDSINAYSDHYYFENSGEDDDVEIKYEPTVDQIQKKSPKKKELYVVLRKIPEPKLYNILGKRKASKLKIKKPFKKKKTSAQKKNSLEPLDDCSLAAPVPKRRISNRKPKPVHSVEGNRKSDGLDPEGPQKRSKSKKVSNEELAEEDFKNEANVDSNGAGATNKKKRMYRRKVTGIKVEKVKKEYTCITCNEVILGREALRVHKRSHRNEMPKREYNCKTCGQMFPRRVSLAIHRREHRNPIARPSEPGPVTCEICGKTCSTFEYYKYRHMKIHEEESLQHVCHICGKVYKLSRHLRVHVKFVHVDEEEKNKKRSECKVCGKLIFNDRLKSHMKIHSAERETFKCTHCDKTYFSKEKCNLHMLLHNSDQKPAFSCQFCGKCFPGNYALKRHEMRHSKIGTKMYPCEVCEKSFAEKYLLVRHKVMHQEDRPFACDQCGKTFKSDEYLGMHCKSVHESKNAGRSHNSGVYKCNLCPKSFSTLKGLLRHQPYHNKAVFLQGDHVALNEEV